MQDMRATGDAQCAPFVSLTDYHACSNRDDFPPRLPRPDNKRMLIGVSRDAEGQARNLCRRKADAHKGKLRISQRQHCAEANACRVWDRRSSYYDDETGHLYRVTVMCGMASSKMRCKRISSAPPIRSGFRPGSLTSMDVCVS
jgi:hypothetical protein